MDDLTPNANFKSPDPTGGEIDFLIIGHGICGTFLSYYLLEAGKRVLVIDDNRPFSASKVASGVINPVTGRRIVRTWMIEELLPFALREYGALGKQLGVRLVKECSVLDFHPSLQMKDAFEKRLEEETEYLHQRAEADWREIFNFHFGVGEISPCLLIDINTLLCVWRQQLQKKHVLVEETFLPEHLTVTDNSITYKNFTADKIIFCDGVNGIDNTFFRNLPYSPNKGEAIIAQIPNLDTNFIYKQGLSIVPWKDDLFWIGSTYEWNFTDALPTAIFKDRVKNFLTYFLKTPFEIVDHIASVRPANMERRPFVGLHPTHSTVGILNGMGTKGCSLAPFFAKQLADLLAGGKPIAPEADVKRFEKILARKMN
ncbi:NAD(P)/FAD-dependent oxidoreductase [Segetibacter aerophilus]|uniref:FAD-dependent oxidoreductase n=1 Tax=Segetibacter aerophilus TaxID=670293 RepID=A0A512BBF7_9BACT|nr:FAD-binding oxidoreductase [Segetibacter aerophilus]GEO09308.1 FAD-dependent oxidoreductase [Segetibacter aerophilus]